MIQRTRLTLATSLLLAALAACGDSSDESGAGDAREVEVDMVDIAFEPDRLEVEQGETIRFQFNNTGDVTHDALIGDADAQVDHERDMRAGNGEADHGGGHDDAGDEAAVTVEPGDSADLTYTFDTDGTTEIGCHQQGHYEAGMTITVEVT